MTTKYLVKGPDSVGLSRDLHEAVEECREHALRTPPFRDPACVIG